MRSPSARDPDFSIVTPTLNRASVVVEAVHSVLRQGDVSFEHIIVDGGSSDDTFERLSRFPHVRLVRGPDEGGYDAINKGIALATGKLVGVLNSDDVYPDGALSAALEAHRRDPGAIQIAGLATLVEPGTQSARVVRATLDLADLAFGTPVYNARFFRRDALLRLGPLQTSLSLAADRDFLLRTWFTAPAFVSVDRVVYQYRVHDDSLTLGRLPRRRLLDIARQHCAIAAAYLAPAARDGRTRRLMRSWLALESMRCAVLAVCLRDRSATVAAVIGVMQLGWSWPFDLVAALAHKLRVSRRRSRMSGPDTCAPGAKRPGRRPAVNAMKVVTVNTADLGGGAERVSWLMFKGLEQRGLDSWLLVGDKKTHDPQVVPFYLSPRFDYRRYQGPLTGYLRDWRKRLDRRLGLEDFGHPFSKHVLDLTGSRPDVVHCHNLHGGYFDLRALSRLSWEVPVFLTLHDCWWFTGHCALPVLCERWRTGCGRCPDLAAPPALTRDATRWNWWRKRRVFQRSRLFVAAPVRWMMQRAFESTLAPAIAESRIIANGIDLQIFRPGSQLRARRRLGLPADAIVIVYVAHRALSNPYKDPRTVRDAVLELARELGQRPVQLLAIGEPAPEERMGNLTVAHLPYLPPEELAEHMRAADALAHASRGEVAGNVIQEAMACGAPVVATAVGGVPELLVDGTHGFLVPQGDARAMARRLHDLVTIEGMRARIGRSAADHAASRFALDTMLDAYASWYEEVLAGYPGDRFAPRPRHQPPVLPAEDRHG
jgi:glycosyltransferase involved in cell wall biosynthesis